MLEKMGWMMTCACLQSVEVNRSSLFVNQILTLSVNPVHSSLKLRRDYCFFEFESSRLLALLVVNSQFYLKNTSLFNLNLDLDHCSCCNQQNEVAYMDRNFRIDLHHFAKSSACGKFE